MINYTSLRGVKRNEEPWGLYINCLWWLIDQDSLNVPSVWLNFRQVSSWLQAPELPYLSTFILENLQLCIPSLHLRDVNLLPSSCHFHKPGVSFSSTWEPPFWSVSAKNNDRFSHPQPLWGSRNQTSESANWQTPMTKSHSPTYPLLSSSTFPLATLVWKTLLLFVSTEMSSIPHPYCDSPE